MWFLRAITGALLALFCASLPLRPLHAAEPTDAAPQPLPVAFRDDANLFDVCFLDANLGWAVGDRGAILHTRDGGQTWEHQESQVGCRLESVHFVDADHGWVVGGWTIPLTHRARAVVLRTEDGGQSWKKINGHFLPWLKQITLRDRKRAVAVGGSSAMSPAGVFQSSDSGEHWSTVPGSSSGWIHAAFSATGHGILLQEDGQVAFFAGDRFIARGRLDQEDRMPQRVVWLDGERRLLAGNQGLVAISEDHGQSWLPPRQLPETDLLLEFDWLATAARNQHVWVAGAPGSRVLVSPDDGQHWQAFDTGHTSPLYALDFLDEQQGWAVGALGSVLRTRDGGKTWHTLRGEQTQLAALAVVGQAEEIPWEVISQVAAAEGQYLGLEVLTGSPVLRSLPGQTPAATRLHEATTSLGGVGANVLNALPSPDARLALSSDSLQAIWDHTTGGDSLALITEYLVRQIRLWRPHLLLTLDPETSASKGLTRLTNRIVMQAIEEAADASRYPGQQRVGLTPWRVTRVSSVSASEQVKGYEIHASRLVLSRGQTVGQLATYARGNLQPSPSPARSALSIRSLDGDRAGAQALFPALADNTIRTRRQVTVGTEDFRMQNQDAQQRRTLETLLNGPDWQQTDVWQQAMQLAAEMTAEDRAAMFLASAGTALRAGRSVLALELLSQLASSPDTQGYAEPAQVQMLRVLSSEEASLHWPRPRGMTHDRLAENAVAASGGETARAGTSIGGDIRPVTFINPAAGYADTLRSAESLPARTAPQETSAADRNEDREARYASAVKLYESIQKYHPDLSFEPQLRLPFASLQRRVGRLDEAKKLWQNALAGRTHAALRSWAAAEISLQSRENQGPLPRRNWDCFSVDRPPRLDGALQDAAWTKLPVVPLTAPSSRIAPWPDHSEATTELRIGYDEEFLYLAATCQKAPAGDYSAATDSSRQRDTTLPGDRIAWYLDVDRDAVTHWSLAVDWRGWANDALLDDPTWDPAWYIAAGQTETHWTVEAAIPLRELAASPPQPGDVWCLGVQRIIPGLGWQTWLQTPPVEQNPAEYGLLMFRE
jgi:photosystem II stability/assembly factor-like uncharacterized protein